MPKITVQWFEGVVCQCMPEAAYEILENILFAKCYEQCNQGYFLVAPRRYYFLPRSIRFWHSKSYILFCLSIPSRSGMLHALPLHTYCSSYCRVELVDEPFCRVVWISITYVCVQCFFISRFAILL